MLIWVSNEPVCGMDPRCEMNNDTNKYGGEDIVEDVALIVDGDRWWFDTAR